jgi:hypothetical protein
MNLSSSLTAVCDLLRSQTGAEVFLGVPDEAAPGIYVWPWRLDEKQAFKGMFPTRNLDPAQVPPPSGMVAHFMVMARPALAVEAMAQLEAARAALLDQSVLTVDGETARVVFETLDSITLAAVFSAAAIPLSICLCATVES